mmetsp:Transcript_8093/g.15911  ORF Transcript_8093/g.15911 Transcript_8093/m.15911 type:complete len:146 (+) Transcript_8093:4234-4671(+)
MGFLSTLFYVVVPGIGIATVAAFSLGKELPKACRRTGRSIGMGYNYVKTMLRIITPESDNTVELVRKMRQSSQQAFAFTNEVKWNMLNMKPDVRHMLPELSDDPFKRFGVPSDVPVKAPVRLTGTQLLDTVYQERSRLKAKERQT